MDDILKNICENLNIKLIYTNNKLSILSCSIHDELPVIRAHHLFRGCSSDIAKAIITYYTRSENREQNLKIIRDYAEQISDIKKYKIVPPNSEFCSAAQTSFMPGEINTYEETEMVELNISSMTKKDFYGEVETIKKNDPIKIDENDMLEVNIIVAPFNT